MRGLKFFENAEVGGRPPETGSFALLAVPEVKIYLLPTFGVLSEILGLIFPFGDKDDTFLLD